MKTNKFDMGTFGRIMEEYLGDQEGPANLFWKAFSYSVNAHQDQRRKSGEAYISHPCHVVRILVEEVGVRDPATLAAAMLHDTVEDVKEITIPQISEMFGPSVAAIVEGCTKISSFDGDRQSFYKLVHRKIFSQASARVEVMLVKLADRLHNLRTLSAMPKKKRQKIADETLSVYAPIARVMGLFRMKRELYELALTYKFPKQSQKVLSMIRRMENSEETRIIRDTLDNALKEAGLGHEVRLKAKGLWAYYDTTLRVLVQEIEETMAATIVVDSIQDCYTTMGVVHQLYPPIPGTVRDFIANPKPTGYQAIHTRINIKGNNYLFKIRTPRMMQVAKNGIINEWLSFQKVPEAFAREIREMFRILGSDSEVPYHDMIAVSGKKEIYTYTPKGDIICLPFHSNVLDFAFKVHTEVGKHCLRAKVGTKQVDISHVLKDGDRVNIITQDNPVEFDPGIQKLCKTPKARSELSRLFRQRRRPLSIKIGKKLVHQELKRYGIPYTILNKKEVKEILDYFGKEDMDDLYTAIGQGLLRLGEVMYEIKHGLYKGPQLLDAPAGALNQVYLDTLDPVCVKLSQCCHPIPSEKGLLALLSERGVSVHDKNCSRLQSLKLSREDIIEIRWHLKKTKVKKPQSLYITKPYSRNRIFMLLSVAPVEMKITEVIALSSLPSTTAGWEVDFTVETLWGLRNILQHFDKRKIPYEFVFEQ
ncbi:MAG: RelA/SpoT family protein [Desulfobia sp.]